MANHGYVKTRMHMSPQRISEILQEINQKYLFGDMLVDYADCSNDPQAWGKHVWELKHKYDPGFYRVCWLNGPRSFEMRHGGGANFVWWVDELVCQSVAIEYSGKISDDCHDQSETVSNISCPTFESFCLASQIKPSSKSKILLKLWNDTTPDKHKFW